MLATPSCPELKRGASSAWSHTNGSIAVYGLTQARGRSPRAGTEKTTTPFSSFLSCGPRQSGQLSRPQAPSPDACRHGSMHRRLSAAKSCTENCTGCEHSNICQVNVAMRGRRG